MPFASINVTFPPHQTPALVARFQQWASAEGDFLGRKPSLPNGVRVILRRHSSNQVSPLNDHRIAVSGQPKQVGIDLRACGQAREAFILPHAFTPPARSPRAQMVLSGESPVMSMGLISSRLGRRDEDRVISGWVTSARFVGPRF